MEFFRPMGIPHFQTRRCVSPENERQFTFRLRYGKFNESGPQTNYRPGHIKAFPLDFPHE